ncbi:MAG: phage exclusion protein Lit family protein [Gemmatimonadota bacterium]|nr:phage exclusion protein Lit family protein [Gemmatimonadota bacterium]
MLKWFESKFPDFKCEIAKIVNAGGASRIIDYNCDEVPILGTAGRYRTPYITEDGKICIHETFLSYVWALSYSIMVIFDEEFHGPRTGQQPGHGKEIGEFLQFGYDVLEYGLYLRRSYKRWPNSLPNPDPNWYRGDDTYYPQRANGIYVAAVDFILCHELGHAACGHLKKDAEARSKGKFIPSYEIKEGEIEADAWALERVIRGVKHSPENKETVGFGAIAGLACLLFLRKDLTSRTHPDTDSRIRAVLERLGEEKIKNLWGIAATYYVAWSHASSAGLDFGVEFDTYGDFVDHIERQLSEIKFCEEKRRFTFD